MLHPKKENVVYEGILSILFPARCALCDRVLSIGKKGICPACEKYRQKIAKAYCMKCGKPLEEKREYCRECESREREFTAGHSAFLYDARMKNSIARFKYHGRREYAGYYAAELYRQWGDWIRRLSPDALVPVPVHRKRLAKRGFNQAREVAYSLSALCGVPVADDWLVRIQDTKPMKELNRIERRANLNQAFFIFPQKGELYKNVKCVIIIDDIYTTGSTIEACAQALKHQGVKIVCFLCVCTGYDN